MSTGMSLGLLLILLCGIGCEGIYYKIKRIECKGNENHFENISCVLKPINWTHSILNMECDIVGNLSTAFLVVDTFYKDYTNVYKPFIFKFRYNICQLLDKTSSSNFMEKYAIHHLTSATNLNHSCPYSGHLYARNFYLEEMSLPPLPLQEYKISFNFIQIKPTIHLGSVFLYFEAREDYRKKTQ